MPLKFHVMFKGFNDMSCAISKLQSVYYSSFIRSELELNELLQMLYYQPIYTILFGHAIAVLITVFFLWGSVTPIWLLSWASIIVAQTFIWIYIVKKFRHAAHNTHSNRKALMVFPIAGAVTGALWGVTLYWPNIITDMASMVFLSIMVLGVSAAGLAVFSPYLRSFFIFASFMLIPFALRFFMQYSKLHWTLSAMFILYFGVLLISGFNMRRAVGQAISLRLENKDLIDELLIKNTQAEESREEAEKANISKSKFLAAASHDLRQPLHALGLFVDALDSRIQYKEVRDIVGNIRISTNALSDLLNALLDISKLDASVLTPKPIPFQLQPLLQRIVTDFSAPAKSKSLRLRVVNCALVVNTDPIMLERILRNLVSNAIRYTQSGGVLLGCRRHRKRNENYISIEIHDTGIGIAPENIECIFEEFYQAENPERDRQKGLGLGLAIVKRLGDLIDCPVSVLSVQKKGSVFRVRVPYVDSVLAPVKSSPDYTHDLKASRVLVIDDEALVRQGMQQILSQWQCPVLLAESIEQALEHISENAAIDIILTDYRLRENQTGLDAIKKIHEVCNKKIPAIILTGDTDAQRLREAKASGFKLLHKPVQSAKLRSLMSYLLEQNDASK